MAHAADLLRTVGRTTGEAYAEFEDSTQAGEALRVKNRQHLGNRYIELFEAGQSDLERLIATDARARAENLSATPTPAIKVVGLPATANQHDVVNLLNGIELLHGADSITIVREPTSSPSAVVQLATSQAQLQALSRSNTLLHGSPVQVLPYHVVEAAVSSAALVAASVPFAPLSQGVVSSSLQNQPASEQQSFPFDTTGATLKLRGLPYSADESDVISFFQGFQIGPEDVHLEVRNDHPSQRTGTGIAYVQFASPEEADRARTSRHKQMMGPRYIECMVFVPGRHYWPRSATATRPAWPQYQLPSRPFLLPASAAFPFNAALPAKAVAFAGNAAADQQSAVWSRPYQNMEARPSSPLPYGSAQATRAGNPRQNTDQATQVTEGRSAEQRAAAPSTALHASLLQGLETAPAFQPLPFGLTPQQQQQQQQLMLQQQFALQQQQQLLLQQQALQAQWGNLQQGGWLRAFPPMPLGLAPGGPLQMPPRGPLQGGMGVPGQPLAYYAPGALFAWTAVHPGQAALVGPGLQQQPRPLFRPSPLGAEQRQTAHSPFGARTPGRGRFRTPFTQSRSAPPAFQQQSELDQSLANDTVSVRLPGIESGPAESSALTSVPALSVGAAVTGLEGLSVSADLAATALRPVITHTTLSPSDVIRASAIRGSSPEEQECLSAGFPSLSDPLYPRDIQGSTSQSLQAAGLPSAVESVDAVATSSLRPSAVSLAMLGPPPAED